MSGITISALAGVNTILGPEEIPLVQNGATSTVTPTMLASFIAGVNTAGTVRSVNVAGGSSGFSFTGGPVVTTGTITLASGALVPSFGGTGLASYAIGDILYATAATTLSKLAGVATGNALISGGVTTAPLWGKVGLATHISGTLTTGNGGTNTTSASTGTGGILLSSSPTINSPVINTATMVTPILGTVSSGNIAACTGFPTATAATTFLTGDVSAPTINTFANGPNTGSIGANGQTWLIMAGATFVMTLTGKGTLQIFNGTAGVADNDMNAITATGTNTMTLATVVTLSAATTFTLRFTDNVGTNNITLKATATNGTTNKATSITAVRLA